MGTFDAGSIEAKLILDRSDFDRKLAEAQAKAQKFESDDATKKLNVEADTSAASAQIAAIEAEIKSLEDAKVGVDVDDAGAQAKIDELKAKLATISNAHAKIDVDTGDSGAKVTRLKSEIAAIPDKKTVKIDVDEGNGVSRTQAMVSAIIAGLPLIPALAAPAAGGIMALAASLSAAAGGAAILGLGLFGAVKDFQAMSKAGEQMNPQMMMFKNALDAIGKAYDNFVHATEGRAFELMASGLNIVAGILPRLVPIFNAFATVANSALTGLGNWFNGPEGQGMLNWFQTFGAQQFGTILSILGNLGRVVLNLLQAFSPLATVMMNGLNGMTASWVTWSQTIATNQGFQQFIAYVQTTGPLVLTTIGNLVRAIINIGVALAPLGVVILGVINDFANLIAAMNPDVLRTLIVIVGGLALAWTAFEAIMSVVRAGMAMWSGIMAVATAAQATWNFLITEGRVQALAMAVAQGIVRAATLAWVAVQWLLNAALTANPIGLIIVAIAALVAAIVLAWQNSETFRNVVIAAWNGIKAAVGAAINFITGLVRSQLATWVPIVTGIMLALTAIFRVQWAIISSVIRVGIAVISAVIRTNVAIWRAIFTTSFGIIRAIVVTSWAIIRATITTAMALIRAVITGNWSAIGGIIRNYVNQIRAAVTSGFNSARAAAVSAFNQLRSGVTSAINGVRSAVSSAISSIRGAFAGAGSWLWNAGWSIINGLISGIKSGIGALGSALGGIGSFITSHKGPPSYDRVMLRPHGRMIMGGLINGFQDQFPALGRTLQGVTNRITGLSAHPNVGGVGGGSASSRDVTVNFHNYYPVAEPSATRATRQMKELSVLGVFN